MKWQYWSSIFLMMLSSVLFFSLAAIHMDDALYYPEGNMENSPSRGYSWIWYHFEHWGICLGLNIAALGLFIYGGLDGLRKSDWKLSDHIKIEVVEDEEPELGSSET